MASVAQDSTARRMASEARDIAIENRTWRQEHARECRELREEFRAMVRDLHDGIGLLRADLAAAVRASNEAREALAEKQSDMWTRIAWSAIGGLAMALLSLAIAVVKGWIG